MNENISKLLEILNHWKNRLPNVDCVSVFLFETELRIRVDWKPVGDLKAYYTRTLPLKDLDNLYPFNSLETVLFDEMESNLS